ncbi:MAG TPA: mannose-6-phosphate isomerase, class I [Micromonosporaceae bacterium]
MRLLTNPIRPYPWGSEVAIAAWQGRPVPSAGPEAELWMGAHPSAPSLVCGPDGTTPLPEVIAQDPAHALGAAVLDRFGVRLPFLLKILAAERPLSLQAHPDADQAERGYARERGKAPDDGSRTYVDPYHKPELLVALDEFDALCGFRDPVRTAALLDSFGVPALKPVIDALALPTAETALRAATGLLIGWPDEDRASLVQAVSQAGQARAGQGQPGQAYALAADLGQRYPGDVGVVLALLLNRVSLRPDDAVFMPAGHLHAYLRGVGIEVMAASDNVLRGGLTNKHVDAAELARILRFEVMTDPVLRPVRLGPGLVTWPAPVDDFALVKAELAGLPVTLPGSGPRIVAVVRGQATLAAGAKTRTLSQSESVFVTASDPAVEVSGAGATVFQASVPLAG